MARDRLVLAERGFRETVEVVEGEGWRREKSNLDTGGLFLAFKLRIVFSRILISLSRCKTMLTSSSLLIARNLSRTSLSAFEFAIGPVFLSICFEVVFLFLSGGVGVSFL